MISEHFERMLRATHGRVPFRPFIIALVNGDRLRVDHPEAMVLRGGVAAFVAADRTPTLFDHEGVSEVMEETQPK